MKLVSLITRKYAYFSALTLIGGLIFLYVFLIFHISEETDERLLATKQNIITDLDSGRKIEYWPFINVTKIEKPPAVISEDMFLDTTIDLRNDGDMDSYRRMTSYYKSGSNVYQITILTHIPEIGEWWLSTGGPMAAMLIFVLIVVTLLMLRYNKKLWQPFFDTIENMKNFSVKNNSPAAMTSTEVDEFRELNASALKLMNGLRHDFECQKEFIDNASHELQTPLAVIKAKTEALLQNSSLPAEDMARLEAIYETANRLSRINKSLNLLLKIDSPAFNDVQNINLREFLDEKCRYFDEIAASKGLDIRKEQFDDVIVKLNSDLLDILITNLLTNAVNYNVPGGEVIINLNRASLKIKNTGAAPKHTPSLMFERFMKDDPAGKSGGLGLSIVRQICDRYGMPSIYNFEGGFHTISIYLNLDGQLPSQSID